MSDSFEAQGLVCSICRSAIEWCQFCDDENCPKAICFTCVIIATRQEIELPHTHGG